MTTLPTDDDIAAWRRELEEIDALAVPAAGATRHVRELLVERGLDEQLVARVQVIAAVRAAREVLCDAEIAELCRGMSSALDMADPFAGYKGLIAPGGTA